MHSCAASCLALATYTMHNQMNTVLLSPSLSPGSGSKESHQHHRYAHTPACGGFPRGRQQQARCHAGSQGAGQECAATGAARCGAGQAAAAARPLRFVEDQHPTHHSALDLKQALSDCILMSIEGAGVLLRHNAHSVGPLQQHWPADCAALPGAKRGNIKAPVAGNPAVYGINTAVLALAAALAATNPQLVSFREG